MSDWDAPRDKAPLVDEVGKRVSQRKDRRRWCRGKVGVEHVPVIELEKGAASYRQHNPALRQCRWDLRYYGDTRLVWTCAHVRLCATCRKVLTMSWELEAVACPEYRAKTVEVDLCTCGHELVAHRSSWNGGCQRCECSRATWDGRLS